MLDSLIAVHSASRAFANDSKEKAAKYAGDGPQKYQVSEWLTRETEHPVVNRYPCTNLSVLFLYVLRQIWAFVFISLFSLSVLGADSSRHRQEGVVREQYVYVALQGLERKRQPAFAGAAVSLYRTDPRVPGTQTSVISRHFTILMKYANTSCRISVLRPRIYN